MAIKKQASKGSDDRGRLTADGFVVSDRILLVDGWMLVGLVFERLLVCWVLKTVSVFVVGWQVKNSTRFVITRNCNCERFYFRCWLQVK